MELETVYLGVIAAAITKENDKTEPNLKTIQRTVEQVVELAGDRIVLYFGARHWHYNMDQAITKAAFDGGTKDCSTDNGAETAGKKGMGTIPHALENIYAYKFGMENAVVRATEAFDKYMDQRIPRIWTHKGFRCPPLSFLPKAFYPTLHNQVRYLPMR